MNTSEQLENIDWSFPNLDNTGIHSMHWYPATYVAAIPGTLIPVFTEKGGLVLDPFNGSGTSGVEAIRLGRNFIGMDTNPVALLMSQAKLHFPEPDILRKNLDMIVRDSETMFTSKEVVPHPNHEELSAWYHTDTLDTLNRILSAILRVDDTDTKRCFLAIFSGLLKNTSSQKRHWGWVCDNVKPKPFEVVYKDALSTFINAANDYITITEQSHKLVQVHSENETRESTRSRYKLVHGDCVRNMRDLPDDHIDFVVTSPPYYGVADYIKSQRLSYLWFDRDELAPDQLGFRDFQKLRAHESGARSNRTRKNSHELYINFINSFFIECYRVLKVGSSMALVVGESGARASTTNELILAAESKGFILSLRRERDIKSSRRRLMASVKCEDILIFIK
ncbi:DNA methyltransferase [Pseudomonas alliivorans]|nr:DNA methyltransferase [Pseudomonas alliivorans]MEE4967618.1 DNA methyltransferase [Pseudomonas alliivorans]MEE4987669.1 DNA methyltransferase [Pseudomonas alliivorans]MEE4992709.1 DNA methyltransferase [Pseudomonas alliivorans]MEE5008309.1 DNA methyltransferase [Pseudomonas alliivorans]